MAYFVNAYADFVMQTDDVIGSVLSKLDECGLKENTIVILSSDNGCSRAAKIGQLAKKGHVVSAGFRGSKADVWDGGHRVPLIIRWPKVVAVDSKCDHLVGLTDIYATIADCLGDKPPKNSCEDSRLPFLEIPHLWLSESQRCVGNQEDYTRLQASVFCRR